jgi:hypothetical protein
MACMDRLSPEHCSSPCCRQPVRPCQLLDLLTATEHAQGRLLCSPALAHLTAAISCLHRHYHHSPNTNTIYKMAWQSSVSSA